MSPDPALALSVFADSDRRANRRYPISLGLTYRVPDGKQAGAGRTLDMGSHGLSCSGLESVEVGSVVEIALDWPILLEDCPLKLVIVGRVLRSDAERTAILILRYQFHTRRHSVQALQVA